MSKDETEKSFSRRNFLKMSGVATGSLLTGTYLGSLITEESPEQTTQTAENSEEQASGENETQQDFTRAYKFFQTAEQFNTIEAAAERIFPEDDNGPGAIGLGVAWFIDHELSAGYGVNEREYMKGPFKEGTDFQGPQYAMRRKDIFLEGIDLLNREANSQFDMPFTDLEGKQQDEILTQLEQNEIDIQGIKSSDFFEELRLVTLSGAYADPLYRGNIDMKGWEMKKFPGSYMSYSNEIETEEFIDKEQQPLSSHINH